LDIGSLLAWEKSGSLLPRSVLFVAAVAPLGDAAKELPHGLRIRFVRIRRRLRSADKIAGE
jgi:hypothetical protein